MNSETLYRQVGRLIASVPDFKIFGDLSPDHLQWIGRASALIKSSGDLLSQAEFSMSSANLLGPRREEAFRELMMILYKVLADAELKSPASAQGAFIPAGNSFDAFAAVSKVLGTAKGDVLIVDPYLDETVLTDFSGAVSAGVALRLLADEATVKTTLHPASIRWAKQYPARPLQVRLAPPKALHDRAIFLDRTSAWILTQSLKDFAKRAPAEIVRADDTAALKIAAYEAVWTTAAVIV
jgi:hypothetical protein